MAAFGNRHKKRKLKNEINVVPYVDVMLVLLVIFMLTSTAMNLGIQVNLPDADARPVEQAEDPVVVLVDDQGRYELRLGSGQAQPLEAAELSARMAALVAENPQAPVFVAADGALPYQQVMDTMSLLQRAGVTRASLVTDPIPATGR